MRRRSCVNFVLLAFFCSILNAEEVPVPTDLKSEPVPISIPDVLTDLPATPVKTPAVEVVQKVENEKVAEPSSANVVDAPKAVADVEAPVVSTKAEKSPPKTWGTWPEIQVTQVEHIDHVDHDRRPPRPYSTAEGVCSSLCHRNGKGFLYVDNDYCWCRCDVQECHHKNFRAIPPPLRNAGCRDHCRSVHSRDSPDGFYDRGRDSCVCQCTPCLDFNRSGPPHTRCQ